MPDAALSNRERAEQLVAKLLDAEALRDEMERRYLVAIDVCDEAKSEMVAAQVERDAAEEQYFTLRREVATLLRFQ